MKPKKKYTEKDYEYVLNRIVESWSDGTLPDTYNIYKELKKKKSRMDREWTYFKEMEK